MPRLSIDYSKGLIYKLCCLDPNVKEIYVGSTTNFVERKKGHKGSHNNPNVKEYNYKVYQHIRAFGGWTNWEMVLIEYFPCDNELELGRRENYWKQELQSSLNSRTPPMYETKQEYMKNVYETNKEVLKEKAKLYKQDNKEQITEKNNQKYTCECGGRYTLIHRARHFRTKVHQKHLAENPDK